MEMENIVGRDKLKTYFYEWHPYLDLMLFIGIIFCCTVIGAFIGLVILGVWAIARITVLLMSTSGDEILYDRILKQDIDFLKRRSVEKIGMVEEEYSLITPIEGIGHGTDDFVDVVEDSAQKKDFIARIIDFFKSIFFKIIAILRALIGRADFLSKDVFFEGNDNKLRTSLVSYTLIVFTEQQIVAYTAVYDIALGVILDENVREVFYRDVDSVTYGEKTLHIFTKKFRLVKDTVTKLRLAVPSGADIVADLSGEIYVLESQIMAMKALIRNKKELMS